MYFGIMWNETRLDIRVSGKEKVIKWHFNNNGVLCLE